MSSGAGEQAESIDAELRRGLLAGLSLHVACALGEDAEGFVARPGEAALIAGAAPRRRADFARGRVAARCALMTAGVGEGPLLADGDRVPRWPSGFVGSIAHSGEFAVAVVARAGEFLALGVDVEVATTLAEAEQALVLTPSELAVVAALPAVERGRAALRYFCAKEAAYKAGFPAQRRIIEFTDMHIEFDGEAFEARWGDPAAASFTGRCARVAGMQFAVAWRRVGATASR